MANNGFTESLKDMFAECSENDNGIEVITLSTADGFSVHSHLKEGNGFESDTMAAAASTLFSVSKAVAQQLLSKEFKSTFIEANQGNVCFVSFSLEDKEYVLAVSADKSMNIASLRLCTNKLAENIRNVS